MRQPILSLIVAVAKNGVMGRDNTMPWHLPSDLKRFRALTLGKPVIMGRKTYDSIGQPLKGRINIIITRSDKFGAGTDVMVAHSLEKAKELAWQQTQQSAIDEVFVIGGAEIFKLALPQADRLYMTEVLEPLSLGPLSYEYAAIDGDTFFPPFEPNLWQAVLSDPPFQGEKDSHPTRFVIYERVMR